jgi:hypothetical protein
VKKLVDSIAKNRAARAAAVIGQPKGLSDNMVAAIAPDFLRVDFTKDGYSARPAVSFEAKISNDVDVTTRLVQEPPSTRNFVGVRPTIDLRGSLVSYEEIERTVKYLKALAKKIETAVRTDRPTFGNYVAALAEAAGFSFVRIFNEPGMPEGVGFRDFPVHVGGISSRIDRGIERHLNGAV